MYPYPLESVAEAVSRPLLSIEVGGLATGALPLSAVAVHVPIG